MSTFSNAERAEILAESRRHATNAWTPPPEEPRRVRPGAPGHGADDGGRSERRERARRAREERVPTYEPQADPQADCWAAWNAWLDSHVDAKLARHRKLFEEHVAATETFCTTISDVLNKASKKFDKLEAQVQALQRAAGGDTKELLAGMNAVKVELSKLDDRFRALNEVTREHASGSRVIDVPATRSVN
jgi:hypothetical protein